MYFAFAASHVKNAADIGRLVITNCQGSSQGNKRIVAVTGDRAEEVDFVVFIFVPG